MVLQHLVRKSAPELRGNIAEAVIVGAVGVSLLQKCLGSIVEMLKLHCSIRN